MTHTRRPAYLNGFIRERVLGSASSVETVGALSPSRALPKISQFKGCTGGSIAIGPPAEDADATAAEPASRASRCLYYPNPSSVAKDLLPCVTPARRHLGNRCRGELPAGMADLSWLRSTELQSTALPQDDDPLCRKILDEGLKDICPALK
ncbi:unnamed protein product [Pleuronectes platessa]|uniref:Uncharacterized protein n=1 Tax=Pleuronectes platessa TaxID=8262 RepID=A0A9N7VWL3_PLEPL|nr:unnamed protein product [Pleuronectes platessa]